MTYKISEKTIRGSEYSEADDTFSDIFVVCEALSAMPALDDETVCKVMGFLNKCETEERELYIKILSKTLRLGVTSKTVNKVIPNLIPEWEIQQAYPITDYPIKEDQWFALTQKLNGVRATYYKGKLIARSGVPYEGLDHIIKTLDPVKSKGMVFDGELTLKDKGSLSDNEAFREATGIINSDAENKTKICYTIFDALPESQFETGESNATYKTRRKFLDRMKEDMNNNDQQDCVSILPVLYSGTDQSKIPELLNKMVEEDKEGLMVNLDVPYKCKRHNGILKVKRFYTMDLPIVGYEEGSGRLSGRLGSFILDYKGNQVKVGSGFSDEQRIDFWDKRDSLLDMLCEVKYKEISSDKNTGAESLQFPVFISLKEDKSEVSYG